MIVQRLRQEPDLVRERGRDAFVAASQKLSASNFLRSLVNAARLQDTGESCG
jgi:hypothetical protein